MLILETCASPVFQWQAYVDDQDKFLPMTVHASFELEQHFMNCAENQIHQFTFETFVSFPDGLIRSDVPPDVSTISASLDVWTEEHDPSSNRPYYVNTESGQTQWEPPVATNPHSVCWIQKFDHASNRSFYCSPATGKSQWDYPCAAEPSSFAMSTSLKGVSGNGTASGNGAAASRMLVLERCKVIVNFQEVAEKSTGLGWCNFEGHTKVYIRRLLLPGVKLILWHEKQIDSTKNWTGQWLQCSPARSAWLGSQTSEFITKLSIYRSVELQNDYDGEVATKTLKEDHPDWKRLQLRLNSCGLSDFDVVALEKVTNTIQLKEYNKTRHTVAEKCNGDPNERELFHWTSAIDAVAKVCILQSFSA
jgi:hypothetical protein